MSKNKVITSSVADGSSLSGIYLYGYILVTSSHGKESPSSLMSLLKRILILLVWGLTPYDLNLNYLLIDFIF